MGPSEGVLRIERGEAGEEELAAVAVVLCAVLAARPEGGGDAPPRIPSWRGERFGVLYRSPYSWR
ncbi:acyl-CoA carboxylase epsilon subunit [Streptomyces ziwulingensis]